MGGGVGQHRLEALTRSSLALAALLGRIPCRAQPHDELVAGALELRDIDEPAGLRGVEVFGVVGAGGLGMSREVPLQTRDLIAQRAAGRGFVATLERRGCHNPALPATPDSRVATFSEFRRGFEHVEIRCVGVASRVEDAGQIARVDAGVTCRTGCGGREVLDRRHGGSGGDEGSVALPGDDEALRLEAAIDGAGGIGIHSRARGELAHPGQPVPRRQPSAHDQRPQAPGEVDPDRQVIAAIQLHLP